MAEVGQVGPSDALDAVPLLCASCNATTACSCRRHVCACCYLWLKASEAPNDLMREVRDGIARLQGKIDKLEDEIDTLRRSIRAAEASEDQAREQVLRQEMAGMRQEKAGMEQRMAELQRKENILLERSLPAKQGV
jgi:septal ring factor EnvC (AmiA/AmiB activator)